MPDDVRANQQGIDAVGADKVVDEPFGIARIDSQQAPGHGEKVEAVLARGPLGRRQHPLLKFVVIPIRKQPQAGPTTSRTRALLDHDARTGKVV